jgi:hypothetical protein
MALEDKARVAKERAALSRGGNASKMEVDGESDEEDDEDDDDDDDDEDDDEDDEDDEDEE